MEFDPLAAIKDIRTDPKFCYIDSSPGQENPTLISQMVSGGPQWVFDNNLTPADVPLRDPDHFVAGLLSDNIQNWQHLLPNNPTQLQALAIKALTEGADVTDFMTPFKGVFKQRSYDCPTPPPRVFKNSKKAKPFAKFIASNITNSLKDGSISLLGRVGHVDPPTWSSPSQLNPLNPG